MRTGTATAFSDARFDMPPVFVVAERRMAGRALDLWRAGGGQPVAGFDAHCLVVADPAGTAMIEIVGGALASAFGLAAHMPLDGAGGVGAEIRAACDLAAISCEPVPFEAKWPAPGGGVFLARGIALPIGGGAAQMPGRIQVIVNWREVLDRVATVRLRRELGAVLRLVGPDPAKIDPFAPRLPN